MKLVDDKVVVKMFGEVEEYTMWQAVRSAFHTQYAYNNLYRPLVDNRRVNIDGIAGNIIEVG